MENHWRKYYLFTVGQRYAYHDLVFRKRGGIEFATYPGETCDTIAGVIKLSPGTVKKEQRTNMEMVIVQSTIYRIARHIVAT